MIRTFEEYTHSMTEFEINIVVPIITKQLELCIGKENALTNSTLIKSLSIREIKTSEPRIRHIIHVLRVSDTIPFLIATSKGYYISNDIDEINEYIGSIEDRLRSIYDIRRSLKRQLKYKSEYKSAVQMQLNLCL
jgi:hypothetical protein